MIRRKALNIICTVIFNGLILLANTLPSLSFAETLPIGMENFPPFEFQQNGEIVGLDTELVKLVLTRLGYNPEIKLLPWVRAQKYAREGTIAGIYSLTKSDDREKYYYFSVPLSTVRDVFFKRKDRQISWNTLSDLSSYRIGISRGYTYAAVFMDALRSNLFTSVHTLSGNDLELRQLTKLKRDRIDICICEVSVCNYLIKTHANQFDMIDFIDKSIGPVRPFYIAFSKKWPGADILVKKFNSEFTKIVIEGRHKEIFEKYGAPIPTFSDYD